ncbi:hypothetical protein BK144_10830 [Paenibacillus sp. FSL R7-0273]|nr:hypothetical protein BK144_10830 [Paenibacillus sp. FSL R7-0273]
MYGIANYLTEAKRLKYIYIFVGFVCVGLGAAGVFLPVLPTTPLLLLAAFCFSRGSERFHGWFLSTGLYKKHLKSFAESRSMTLKDKVLIQGFASTMLLIAFIITDSTAFRILLVTVAIGLYYYFARHIATIRVDRLKSPQS